MNLFCVTDRTLCESEEAFFQQIGKISHALGTNGAVIVREKDMPEIKYTNLAVTCKNICSQSRTPIFFHSHIGAARKFKTGLHLPFSILKEAGHALGGFLVGTSVHSAEEAKEAEALGAAYVIAGHIFETSCKPDAEPRGLDFLRKVTAATSLPVYAIGGITPENGKEVLEAGAAGLCVMSRWMTIENVEEDIARYQALFTE